MSKLNRFDVYIGILDDTNDLIKRAENQYKFEKYLTDFLNTNIYSKDKKWVFGTDRQISQHCKHKIDTIFGLQNKIIDLKSQLAEKEKEIEELKAQRRIYLNRSVEECNKITDLEFELQHKSQDKISFAIAELEKVKMLIHNAVNIDSPEYDLVGLYDAVSNQIKQLKEKK